MADSTTIGCNFLLYETFGVINMINIADLKDPNDSQGRTYREVNNATQHAFAVGDLVELENGVRLFVAKQTRDCDGTPLYSMTYKSNGDASLHGFSEDDMERV